MFQPIYDAGKKETINRLHCKQASSIERTELTPFSRGNLINFKVT